jgi:hypothetical protein
LQDSRPLFSVYIPDWDKAESWAKNQDWATKRTTVHGGPWPFRAGELKDAAERSQWKPTLLLARDAELDLHFRVPLPEELAEAVYGPNAVGMMDRMLRPTSRTLGEELRTNPPIASANFSRRPKELNFDRECEKRGGRHRPVVFVPEGAPVTTLAPPSHSRVDSGLGHARRTVVDAAYEGALPTNPIQTLGIINFNPGTPRQGFSLGDFFSNQAAQVLIVQEAAPEHYAALKAIGCHVVVGDGLSEQAIASSSEFANPTAIAVKAPAVKSLTRIFSRVVPPDPARAAKAAWKCYYLVAKIEFRVPYAGLNSLTVASLHYNNVHAREVFDLTARELYEVLQVFAGFDVDIVGVDLNQAAEGHRSHRSSSFSIAMTRLLAEYSLPEPKFATLLAQPPLDCGGFIVMPKRNQRESPLLHASMVVHPAFLNLLHRDMAIRESDGDSHYPSFVMFQDLDTKCSRTEPGQKKRRADKNAGYFSTASRKTRRANSNVQQGGLSPAGPVAPGPVAP